MSQIGSTALRKEVVDGVIKGRADASYKFKQAVSISTTTAWDNTFYRESSAALAGKTGNETRGLPRGGNFPQAVVEWSKHTRTIEKYGLEDNIIWEDILTDNINVQARTLFKIADGVAKMVDDEIWDTLSEDRTAVEIQQVIIETGNGAESRYWDSASAAIIDDLMHAKQLIGQFNYPTTNLMCFISEKDHRSVVKFVTDSGAQFDRLGDEAARNGRVQGLAGIKFIVSNSVTASYALVVLPKVCATWKAAVPLSTDVTVDPFKSVRVRAVEEGVLQMTDPRAVVLISGTQA